MYRMALAFVALGQGVPFFHAGDDILRSKSLDRDSYDSGGGGGCTTGGLGDGGAAGAVRGQ